VTPVLAALKESLLLADAEKCASAYTVEQAAEIERLTETARSHMAVARDLGAPRDDGTRVALLREAVLCWKRARRTATGDDALEIMSEDRSIVERALAVSDETLFETWSRDDLEAAAEGLARTARIASRSFVWRSVTMIRTMRAARYLGLGLIIVFVAWRGTRAILMPPNVALGRPVTSSGLATGSAPVETLVDGVDEARVPVVANWAAGAWIAVDLGANYNLKTVRVVDRQDRSFDDGLPFWLEFSSDGEHFTPVIKQRDHFRTWTFDVPREVSGWVRAVRLRCVSTCAIGLTEIEVRGRPSR